MDSQVNAYTELNIWRTTPKAEWLGNYSELILSKDLDEYEARSWTTNEKFGFFLQIKQEAFMGVLGKPGQDYFMFGRRYPDRIKAVFCGSENFGKVIIEFGPGSPVLKLISLQTHSVDVYMITDLGSTIQKSYNEHVNSDKVILIIDETILQNESTQLKATFKEVLIEISISIH
jgi:hypothetical protein